MPRSSLSRALVAAAAFVACASLSHAEFAKYQIEQMTEGPGNIFFGYNGDQRTIHCDDPLRIDKPPRWNHDASKILFESIVADGIRQLFVAHLRASSATP